MRVVLLCNPENRRVQAFCHAAEQINLLSPIIISYNDILDGKIAIGDYLGPDILLRIESPGENFDTVRKLIARGAKIPCSGSAKRISSEQAMELPYDCGRIQFLRQWYLGFKDVLEMVDGAMKSSHCRVFNSPAAVSMMFDKVKCQKLISDHNVPVPNNLGNASNYDQLVELLQTSRYKQLFIKPAHASSASGVIGYRRQGSKEEIVTSIELVQKSEGVRFYNSLKLRRYNDHKQIRLLLDFILNEGALIEHWIPKASIRDRFFDVRVVVVNGRARAVIPRLSNGPITNLHLGNARGSVQELKSFLGSERYAELIECAEKAVTTIKGAFYAGVDVLITAGSNAPRVLELNAFGDLLPGVITDQGDDIYTCALKEVLDVA